MYYINSATSHDTILKLLQQLHANSFKMSNYIQRAADSSKKTPNISFMLLAETNILGKFHSCNNNLIQI